VLHCCRRECADTPPQLSHKVSSFSPRSNFEIGCLATCVAAGVWRLALRKVAAPAGARASSEVRPCKQACETAPRSHNSDNNEDETTTAEDDYMTVNEEALPFTSTWPAWQEWLPS
jgi:hypothetical protein